MSTLDDLRSTLDQHAHGFRDDAAGERADAVRGRVRAVRRRRAGAVVAAAAVVVAGIGVAVVDGGRGIDPASERQLVGQVAPATITSLGWTYEFAEGIEGGEDGDVRLQLEASDEPRLVSWGTATDAQDVVYRLEGSVPGRSTAADFEDFVLVPPGFEGTFALDGAGTIGAAVYELSDEPPEGVYAHGVGFRQEVAGATLLDAVVGDPGEAELELEVVPDDDWLSIRFLCARGGDRLWPHVSIEGREVTWGAGCGDRVFDPGSGGFGSPVEAGDPTRLRLWVTRGEGGPVVDDPDLQLGLGAYAEPEPASEVIGMGVDGLVERDGHLWRLVDTTAGEVGQREVLVPALGGSDTLLVAHFANLAGGTGYPVIDGRRVGGGFSAGSGAVYVGILHGQGQGGGRITGDPGPVARLGVARYERVD